MTHEIAHHELLLVDPDVAFRDALSAALERFGISIVWRARVQGLLEVIAETRPLAVVLSGELPRGEPTRLLRSIRARQRWRQLPVYVVGSGLSRAEVLQAYVEGADSVLTRSAAVSEIAARALGRTTALDGQRTAGENRGECPGAAIADAALDLCGSWPPASPGVAANLSSAGGGSAPGGGTPDVQSLGALGSAAPRPGLWTRTPPSSRAHNGDVPPTAVPIGVSRSISDHPPLKDNPPGGAVIRAGTPVVVPDVIIVEDDASLLEMLRYALTNRGYQTLSFSNGLDALRAMREMDTAGRLPVVLLDVDLPGIDGFRILHELSGSRPGDFQVILCTVHNSEATQVLGIQSGALDYLVKPLRMPIVLAKVERLVGAGSFTSAALA